MLPTEQKDNLSIIMFIDKLSNYHATYGNGIGQHLYIISDDEIKEDDWCIGDEIVYQYRDINTFSTQLKSRSKKIVATTNKSLEIKYNSAYFTGYTRIGYKPLPQLPESFIQAYIKAYNDGKPITEVDLEMTAHNDKPVSFKEWDGSFNFIKTRADNSVIVRESVKYSFEDLCSLTTFVRDYNYKFEGKGITNTEIINKWKNGEI